jgi:alkanesulfonate monooxygenase SsuD/methylene tetrahydromethanopterin reductase-like flavin-dependent oxidoreductase (luciferase family)
LLTADDPHPDERKIKQRVGPAMKAGCVGHPSHVRDQIARFRDIGIELLLFKFVPTKEDVRRVADCVIEPLRSAGF